MRPDGFLHFFGSLLVWKLVVLLDVGGYVPYLFPKLEIDVVGLEESGG